jgi:hypothetical protein
MIARMESSMKNFLRNSACHIGLPLPPQDIGSNDDHEAVCLVEQGLPDDQPSLDRLPHVVSHAP